MGQLQQARDQAKRDLTHHLFSRWSDPTFIKHIYEARVVLELGKERCDHVSLFKNASSLFEGQSWPFRLNVLCLATFMEYLAASYFQEDVDRDLVWKLFYKLVVMYFELMRKTGIYGHMQSEYGIGVLHSWKELAKEFENRRAPH